MEIRPVAGHAVQKVAARNRAVHAEIAVFCSTHRLSFVPVSALYMRDQMLSNEVYGEMPSLLEKN
jgi:hypothetical protein